MIGHLQANKAARAMQVFEAIHSVDSVDLTRRLDRLSTDTSRRDRYPVFLQVNVDADPAKGGFDPTELERRLLELGALSHLELRGLMTVGRQVAEAEDARATFARLRDLRDRLRAVSGDLGPGLSMGMSDDFEVAVEEGATVVRVGRALFGERLRG
jgi:pyridoxal phosphate enzyme (YggS family)